MESFIEKEIKFAVDQPSVFEKIIEESPPQNYIFGKSSIENIEDAYADTRDYRIIKSRLALRYRKKGEKTELTLKELGGEEGGIVKRLESTVTVTGQIMIGALPPSSLADFLKGLTGGSQIHCLFQYHQERTIIPVIREGRHVVDIYLDSVNFLKENRDNSFFAVEVEVTEEGEETDLVAMKVWLESVMGLVSETESKFMKAFSFYVPQGSLLTHYDRFVLSELGQAEGRTGERAKVLLNLDEGQTRKEAGQQLALSEAQVRYIRSEFVKKGLTMFPEEEIVKVIDDWARSSGRKNAKALKKSRHIRLDDDPETIMYSVLLSQFTEMEKKESGVLEDRDIEYVHDMRVATRRMRTAFKIFKDIVNQKNSNEIQKFLKKTAGLLGNVRDLQVFIENAQSYLAWYSEERRPDLSPLLNEVNEQLMKQKGKLFDYLRSGEYTVVKRRIRRILEERKIRLTNYGSTPEFRYTHQVRYFYSNLILQQYTVVSSFRTLLYTNSKVKLEDYHDLRINCKMLRYILEFIAPAMPKGIKDVIGKVKAAQDTLGSLQDACVASDLVSVFLRFGSLSGKEAPFTTENAVLPGVTQYLADLHMKIQKTLEVFPHSMEEFDNSSFRKGLYSLVAKML